jgi:hypothetical protein
LGRSNVDTECARGTTDLGNAALEKVTQYQKELNEAMRIFRATGLAVTNFGMDMAVPRVVRLTLVGTVEAIQPDTHKEKKIVVMVLEACGRPDS